MYALVGEPPSPDFFDIGNTSGVITIKKNLMTDYAPYYVVRDYVVTLQLLEQ